MTSWKTSVLGVGSNHGFLISTPNPHVVAWLTGGSFGPDAALQAMILGLLINIVLWSFAFGSQSNLGTFNQRGHSSALPPA